MRCRKQDARFLRLICPVYIYIYIVSSSTRIWSIIYILLHLLDELNIFSGSQNPEVIELYRFTNE